MNPGSIVLGGITTNKEFNQDNSHFKETINILANKNIIEVKNDIFVTIREFDSSINNFKIEAYNWKTDILLKTVSFKSIDYKINWSRALTKGKNIIIDEILKKPNINLEDENKLYYELQENSKYKNKAKFELSKVEGQLKEISEYLIKKNDSIESEVFNKILYTINDLDKYLKDKEEKDTNINRENQQKDTLNYLTDLLEKQINITNKINLKYLEAK